MSSKATVSAADALQLCDYAATASRGCGLVNVWHAVDAAGQATVAVCTLCPDSVRQGRNLTRAATGAILGGVVGKQQE